MHILPPNSYTDSMTNKDNKNKKKQDQLDTVWKTASRSTIFSFLSMIILFFICMLLTYMIIHSFLDKMFVLPVCLLVSIFLTFPLYRLLEKIIRQK